MPAMAGRPSTAFRYADVLARGGSRAQIERAIDNGRIVRLGKGVYAYRAGEIDEVGAAVLRVGAGAVASHETAARLWGIPVLGRPTGVIHLTRGRRRTGTDHFPGVTVHHAAVPEHHRRVRHGVPVTTPARTVMDLARAGKFRAGVSAADGALRLRLCTRDEMLAVTEDCAGWPGVRRARQVARFADRRAANPLESISRVAFHDFGLPAPLLQAELPSLDIADFLWDAYRVVGEADGMGKYVDLDVVRDEKHRQDRIEDDGFTLVRWTWRDVYWRPDAVAYRAGRTLYRRGWQP